MSNHKFLEKILKLENKILEQSHFNPFLVEKTAEDLSECMCKAIVSTADNNESELKKQLRKSVVKFTKTMCKNSQKYNFIPYKSRSDILIKHLYINNNSRYGRPSRCTTNKIRKHVYNTLDTYRHEYLSECFDSNNAIDTTDIELGVALINTRSEICNEALCDIVERCLNLPKDTNGACLEFLKSVWENCYTVIPTYLYDRLTIRLIYLIEIIFLDLASALINESRQCDIAETSIENKLSEHISNFPFFFERLANSSRLFYVVLKILADIFIKSYYASVIEKLIIYFVNEVKTRNSSENIICLYPNHLNEIVLFLQNDPEDIKDIEKFYNHILSLVDSLCEKSEVDFIILMSHYNNWHQHYLTRFKK